MVERITYSDDDRLPEFGYGITNIVPRPTPGIDTIEPHEYPAGRLRLRRKILRYRPPIVAMVGVTVFRAMFPERKAAVALGPQKERIGDTEVFVLPNPSGRNANFSYAEMLAAFRLLKRRAASKLMRRNRLELLCRSRTHRGCPSATRDQENGDQ